jgi:hypothetical protein
MKLTTKQLKLATVILTLILLIIVGSLIAYFSLNGNDDQSIDVTEEISYTLKSNATDVQKVYFDELKLALLEPTTEPDIIASLIVKNYIADFYTWTNKEGSYDVGGLQYVYAPNTLYVQTEAKSFFYKDLSYYMNQYGGENLLKVSSVNIKYVDKEPNYVIEDSAYPSYYVAAEWTYEPNAVFSPEGFQTKAYFSVLVNNGQYQIYRYFLE